MIARHVLEVRPDIVTEAARFTALNHEIAALLTRRVDRGAEQSPIDVLTLESGILAKRKERDVLAIRLASFLAINVESMPRGESPALAAAGAS